MAALGRAPADQVLSFQLALGSGDQLGLGHEPNLEALDGITAGDPILGRERIAPDGRAAAIDRPWPRSADDPGVQYLRHRRLRSRC